VVSGIKSKHRPGSANGAPAARFEDFPCFRICAAAACLVVTGASRGAVDEALNSPILKALSLTASDEVFARHGARHPLGEGFSGSQDLVPHAFDEQTALSHAAQVPPSVVREVFLSGTPDEVIDQAAQWRDHGARYVVVADASSLQRSLRKGLAATMPFAKILRGSKSSRSAVVKPTITHQADWA
jgi:phthiodiolone/phenolphthiodiolone dimycocerosates ketoreductase